MPITASVMISGRKYADASGNNCRQYRSMPKVPTLSMMAIISTALAGVASTAASGSQRWNGHSGALTANANMKPRNSALRIAGLTASSPLDTAATIARKSKVPASKASLLGGHHVQADRPRPA